MITNRREFLRQISAGGLGALASSPLSTGATHEAVAQTAPKPRIISSANGLHAIENGMALLRSGSDALDAVIASVKVVEDDPNDTSVGYGGLPNENGVVELDAAVMHGPTHRAGAVAALCNIKNPSAVARVVMERSDHVLLVGEGALRFAKAHGFKEEDLLTDRAREEWLKWKENLSAHDDWLPPHDENTKDIGALFMPFVRHHGTIHCSALDTRGNMSCTTTTSGLAFKMPGRVGDSPIVGAGLYVDNEVGSAGSTGRGEANLTNCSSALIIEWMRQGKSPEEACLLACKRIVDHNKMRRLKDKRGLPGFGVNFYALNKKGEIGGASIFEGATFAVHDGTQARLVSMSYLYEKSR